MFWSLISSHKSVFPAQPPVSYFTASTNAVLRVVLTQSQCLNAPNRFKSKNLPRHIFFPFKQIITRRMWLCEDTHRKESPTDTGRPAHASRLRLKDEWMPTEQPKDKLTADVVFLWNKNHPCTYLISSPFQLQGPSICLTPPFSISISICNPPPPPSLCAWIFFLHHFSPSQRTWAAAAQ